MMHVAHSAEWRRDPLPRMAILALLVAGQDASRVAAAFDTPCSQLRTATRVAALDLFTRLEALGVPHAKPRPLSAPGSYPHKVLIAQVAKLLRSHYFQVVSVIEPSEFVEISEVFAYYRAFCNSPVQLKGANNGTL